MHADISYIGDMYATIMLDLITRCCLNMEYVAQEMFLPLTLGFWVLHGERSLSR
jgi:hypothetical protein